MTYVPDELRRRIMERASNRCEYCLMSNAVYILQHEIDHIYAEKHGGATDDENLCLSCMHCNRYKGSDLCSLDPETGNITRLFHPRRDKWHEHFELSGAIVKPITPEGRVTVFLLRINAVDRLTEREILRRKGLYPR